MAGGFLEGGGVFAPIRFWTLGPFASGETYQSQPALVGGKQCVTQRAFVVGVADIAHRSVSCCSNRTANQTVLAMRCDEFRLISRDLIQKSRPREHHRDGDSAQDALRSSGQACATRKTSGVLRLFCLSEFLTWDGA